MPILMRNILQFTQDIYFNVFFGKRADFETVVKKQHKKTFDHDAKYGTVVKKAVLARKKRILNNSRNFALLVR